MKHIPLLTLLKLVTLLTLTAYIPISLAAQEEFEELEDYIILDNTNTPTGNKIIVEEAFWYGCPHCNALHPYLKRWLAKKPEDVDFRLLPVPFQSDNNPWTQHARLYYSLELLTGKDETKLYTLHDAVFHAIHTQKNPMRSIAQIARVTNGFGYNDKQMSQAMESFAVSVKVNKARALAKKYQISGVPSLVVNGRYLITSASAKGNARMIRILNYLIAKEKQAASNS